VDELPIISCRADYARYRLGSHHVGTLQPKYWYH